VISAAQFGPGATGGIGTRRHYSIALESWSMRSGSSLWMTERVARADALFGGPGPARELAGKENR
jgi:hypothetical protein